MGDVVDIGEAPSKPQLCLIRIGLVAGTTDDGQLAAVIDPDDPDAAQCVDDLGIYGFIVTKQLVIELAELAGLGVTDPAAEGA